MCISSHRRYLTNAKNINNPNDCVFKQNSEGESFSFNQGVLNNFTPLHNDFSYYTIIWNGAMISY